VLVRFTLLTVEEPISIRQSKKNVVNKFNEETIKQNCDKQLENIWDNLKN
jgi:hypothetical protein